MLRFYIGFQVIKFYCFLSTTATATATATTFLLLSFTTTTTVTKFQLFSILLLLVSFFFSRRFYKRLRTAIMSSFGGYVSCSRQQSWFSSAVSWLPVYQRQFLLKTATPQQIHALVLYNILQVLYNILMEHISIPEENKRMLLSYKDALLDLARPNVP